MKTKVMIVSPSHLICDGVRATIERMPDFTVAGAVEDMQTFEERVGVCAPDIVVLDSVLLVATPHVQIYSTFAGLQNRTVVCLATCICPDDTLRQTDGVIGLYDDEERIAHILHTALENSDLEQHHESNDISGREREILVLVAGGMTNKEIADRLNISVHTVIAHRKNISRKTGIKSVAGLTVYAMMNNMINGK